MAPARRKGFGRNPPAAATRRDWKVGDLVLAKVKGFPAWPATVSEPQKWGYSTDWKKVLVYFFGTKQIAFCNPADVEAFTEEKKNILLGKRYGRGSDFGRAVNEIVDTYEKLKKRDEGDQLSNEAATMNSENSENFPRETPCLSPKTCASLDHSDSCSADGNHLASEASELHDAEVASKGSVEHAFGLDQLSQTHLSIKKISQVESGASQTVRKSRSSSRVDSDKHYQILENDMGTNGFIYKNERVANIVRESLQSSECPDLDLLAQSAIVSSNPCHVSEVLKIDREAGGDNVQTHVKSSSSYEDHGPPGYGGCVENGTLSSRSDESEASAFSVKRKRESIRSEEMDDAVETSFLDEKGCPQNELKKQSSCFSDACENCDDKTFGVDDDEHLPLVKRARVRMGKIASNEIYEEVDGSGNIPNFVETKSMSSSCYTVDSQKSRLAEYVRLDNSDCGSPCHIAENNVGLPNGSYLSDGNHIIDDESDLPPSKRLHRALKAMNANVAEGALQAEISANGETPLRKCSTTSSGKSGSFEAQDALLSNVENSCIHAFSVLENESQTRATKQKSVNDVAQDSRMDRDNVLVMNVATDLCQPRGEPYDMEIDENFFEANEKVLGSSILPNHVVSTMGDAICEEKVFISPHISEECMSRNLETGSSDNGDMNLDSDLEKSKVKGYFSSSCPTEGVKSLQSKFSAKLKLNMHELQKEAGAALTRTNNENLSNVSNNIAQFISPVSASKPIDCTAVGETILYQDECSFSDQLSCHSNDGGRSCSIDGDNNKSLIIKDKHSSSEFLLASNHNSLEASKFQEEANLIWRSFKAVVQSLSRAKESISRATRFALDCAKHGLCHEVIELILTHLESESSLHRKIDLFFLVDSITQCSRGQKGLKGVSYSSAVELVLPRLLSAAAPPGNGARENRKQCLKVLRLWLERRVLSESIVRQHLQELESYNETSFSYPDHPTRTERGLNDPLVEAEGMLVDEYGSNTSIQLSGFAVPQILENGDSLYNDVQPFKTVTSEREKGIQESISGQGHALAVERHPHILEEVDGELEMEDVAPTCDSEVNSGSSVPFVPPLPEELPPSPPPLPVSPPPTTCSVFPSPVIRMPSVFPRGAGDHWPRQSTSLTVNSVFSEPLPCRAPGLVDNSLRPSIAPPFRSDGISRGPHPSIHPSNNDGKLFDPGMAPRKPPYHIRPPTVSNQFSYVHADSNQHNQPRNYSSNLVHQRSNFESEMRGSNNVGCRNRMSLVEVAANERCRYSSTSNSGGQRHDKSEGFYPPIPHRPRPVERPFSDHGWHISRRPLHLRHQSTVSPPFENLSRAPQFWRPR